ncbi:hypothetical protein TSMEX_006498 [Taenia solium]|eukprot:TsM_000468700 transcript=TsM_000468700 gene=TsM_000468700
MKKIISQPLHPPESLCQKLYEAAQLEEKLANKRLKAETIRKSKSLRNLSHTNHFENISVPNTSDRQRKRAKLKPGALSHPTLAGTSLERDKMSSSSSYDRLSPGEANSPGSGTESSSSAPSKLVENLPDPPSGFPRKGVMEILQEESASSSSKTRRMCGGLTKPLASHPMSRSVSSLVNSHSQSYPSSPASPPICDRKEATCVSPNGHSTRKKISVRTMQSEHVEVPRICPTKQAPGESQMHARMRSQFESCIPHSMSFKRHHVVRKPLHSVESVETVDLVSNPTPDADPQPPHAYVPSDESATLFHLEQESRMSMGRSQLMRSNRSLRNGSKPNSFDYVNLAKTEKSWNAADLSASSDAWPRNSHLSMAGANYYGAFVDFEPMYPQQTEKRTFSSGFAMFNQGSRNSPDRSIVQPRCDLDRPMDFTSEHTVINLLTQCGCVEMGDLRCKNSILCTYVTRLCWSAVVRAHRKGKSRVLCMTHTLEEKRRVHRPRDLKVLLHEARQQQQQHLMRLHEASVPAKIRRVSSSSMATPALPTTSATATAASMMASTSRGGLTSATPSTQRLPTNSSVSVPARRVPVNGITAVESQSLTGVQQQQQQQPTILHRRVHHPSSLLRRNQQMWGQEKSSPSFSTGNANSAAFYANSSASVTTPLLPPPSTSVITKMARDAGHLGSVSEVQSRVVVNDEREKSITGRSRKSSRSGMRQPASSMHSPYIQHLTAASNRASSTAVLLRASTANQIDLRSAAAARDPAGTATWMGYNRVANASDLQLTVPASPTTTASRHSTSTAAVPGPTTMGNPHAFGSNRLIFIGSKSLKKVMSAVPPGSDNAFASNASEEEGTITARPGSGNRLTVVPSLNIIQAPRHHQQRSQSSSAPPIGSAAMHLETPREIIIDAVEEDDGVGVDADVESVETAAELEAAVAASAIASASNNVDSIDHHHQQQQFSRTAGGGAHHKANLRPSLCSVPAGQLPRGIGVKSLPS